MYLLWWVSYSSPKRVTDLFGRTCIYIVNVLIYTMLARSRNLVGHGYKFENKN